MVSLFNVPPQISLLEKPYYFITFTDNESSVVKWMHLILVSQRLSCQASHKLVSLTRWLAAEPFNSRPPSPPPNPVMGRTEASVVAFLERAGRQVSAPSSRRPLEH